MPSGRAYATELMTWDPADGYVLLFGGSNATGTYNGDTWTYLHGVWTELTPAVAPTGRDSSALVYDALDNYVVLFGGYTPDSGGILNDTWIFEAGVWQLDPHASEFGPSPRWGFTMTFDAATDYVVLFGGYSPLCTANTFRICNDTWRFWFGGWDRLTPAHSPAPRDQAAMTYDARDGYPLLFGGYGPECLAGSFLCQDTWFWNATGYGVVGNWTQVKTGGALCGTAAEGKCNLTTVPGERIQIQLGFDAADNEVVMFGGENNSRGTLSDTWVYAAGNWTRLASAAEAYGRWGAPIVFDAADGYLMMWGGGSVPFTPVDQVWKFSAGNWTEIGPGTGPGEAYGASMTFDPVDGYVVFFGGYSLVGGFLQQTWVYHSGIWVQLPIPSFLQPPARFLASMTWDGADRYVLLFGGSDQNDTWSFVGGAWKELCASNTPACAPPGREAAGLVYNPNDGYPELFGGEAFPVYLNDTWIWLGSEWLLANPSHAPSPRAQFGMTWDAADGEVVLFGGQNNTAAYQDTYTLTSIFSGWTEVGTCGGPDQVACGGSTPSPRYSSIFVYDGADGFVYAAAGAGSGVYQSYSYAFKAGVWYFCPGYFCLNGYPGWAPYIYLTAAAYDPIDGYVVDRSGLVPFGEYGGGSYSRDTWVFGRIITGTPPASSFGVVDLGQTTSLVAGAEGGGSGSFSYQWNGLPEGCVPTSPGATALSCTVTHGGYTFYYNHPVYGSYFVLSTVITDSNGFPGITTYEDSLTVAPDPSVALNESTAIAEVGQTVWLNATVEEGWGPYVFGSWSGLPAGCAVVATSPSTEEQRCALTAADLGRWSIEAVASDSTSFSAASPPLPLTVYPALGATGVTVSRLALDAGQTLAVGTTASGGVGPYSFTWSGVPTACEADAALLTCSVPPDEVGSYVSPHVVITDADGVAVEESNAGTILVSPLPTATVVTVTGSAGAPVANVTSGSSLTFTLTSTPGSGADTIVWTGLPAGCTPTGADAESVTCSPTAAGTYVVFASVNDSNAGSATSPFASLTISPPPTSATPAPAAPFATSVQWLQLALLVVLIVIALVALLLALRRRPPNADAAPAPPPPVGAGAAAPPPDAGPPDYRES